MSKNSHLTEKNLALEFVRVTETAAIAAAEWIGKGDKNAADQAAVDEMRSRLNQIHFCGTIVIGEGSKDEAPMLYTGEQVGLDTSPLLDIAVDPLECTDSVAYGRYNAISVIATGSKGSLLHAPDTYMEKIAVSKDAATVIDIDAPVADNIKNVAKALGKNVSEVTVMMLDRERHKDLMTQVRKVGARIRLITDGDVSGAIAAAVPDSDIDMLLGSGGSTEAVLAAVPVKIFGGQLLARFKPRNEKDITEIKKSGINLQTIFTADDLAKGNELTFTATGIIDGPLLQGVQRKRTSIITHSIAMRSASKTIRYITAQHDIQ